MELLGNNIQLNKTYFFLGSLDLIEEFKTYFVKNPESTIFLGIFLGFQGSIVGFEWFDRAKAKFENGIISCGYYNKIIENIN